jgi:hypothetical protein
MTRRDRWLGVLLGAALLFGCVTDHDALQKKADTGSGAGGASSSAGGPAQASGAGGAVATGGGHADDEAPGTSVFTIIDGLVDAPSVVLCWAKVDAAGGATPFGNPLGGVPLAYGQSLVVSAVAGANVATDTLQPFAIAGQLDLVSGLDCEAAVARAEDEEMAAIDANTAAANAAEAGAAGESGAASSGVAEVQARLRVRGLPSISAGTLSAGFSILYVSTGCMGGATYTGKNATEYCGTGYTERDSTASAVLVSLSRKTQIGFTGLQFVHASLATAAVDVSSRPPFPSTAAGVAIVSNVVEGQAAPRPALLGNAASAFGLASQYRVQVSVQGVPQASYDWTTALQSGGLTGLTDGRTYALVLLGPRADHVQATALWNPSSLTVIAVDPIAQ